MGFWPATATDLEERLTAHGRVFVHADQPATVQDLVARSVAERPSATAVTEVGGRSLTYEQLWVESEALAAGLQRRYGLESGERVAMLFSNRIDLVVAVLATLRAGGVAVTLNTKYTGRELEPQLRLSQARVLLAEAEFWSKAAPILARTSVRHAAVSGGGDGADPLEGVRGTALREAAVAESDPAVLMYTSGTTGISKGALQSHTNVVTAAMTFVRCLGLGGDDRTVVAAPLFHVTGLNGQLLPILAVGGSAALLPRFDAARLGALLAGSAATFFHAAPTIYVLTLLAARGRATGLRVCVCGGAAVSQRTIDEVRAFAPAVDFRISYGLTETSSPGVLTPGDGWLDRRPGAAGVAVPVNEIRTDRHGELFLRGATVIAGYDGDPDATAAAFAAGWLRTGDIGTIDDEGFVTVLDRIKDLVNRGAEKVASVEVERALTEHPAVVECAVVPRPHEVYGEVPHAVVVLCQPGAATAEELRVFAAERLASFKVPESVEFATELPRNPGGKVLKQLLR